MEILDYNQAAQIARVYNFYFFETCNCGGSLMKGWKHRTLNYYLKLRPNKKHFSLLIGDNKHAPTLITGSFNKLEEAIHELH